MRSENVSRKIDTLGRITLPKGLRDRMFLQTDDELEFYTTEVDGREFICMAPAVSVDPKLLVAKAVLEELGAPIPQELAEKFHLNQDCVITYRDGGITFEWIENGQLKGKFIPNVNVNIIMEENANETDF